MVITILLITTIYSVVTPADKKASYDDDFGSKLDFNQSLVEKWAPVFIQYTSQDNYESDLGYAPDFITKVNYDNDWITNNNWDNLDLYYENLNAHVYYWGFQQGEYTVLGYMVYHPRDWSNNFLGWEHENDAEGVFILLRENGEEMTPLVISTLAHDYLRHYRTNNSIPDIPGLRSLKETFETDQISQNPMVYIESMSHGIHGLSKEVNDTGTYITYRAGERAEAPSPHSTNNDTIAYQLLPINELWDKRYDTDVFFQSGYFSSDKSDTCNFRDRLFRFCTTHAANPPWLWGQNQAYDGEVWYEPLLYYKSLLQIV